MQDQPKTILLADAEEFVLVAYKNALEEAGYRVMVVTDGDAALEQIQAVHPDLVILDLILPKTNGFDVLRQVHASGNPAAMPVVVLTSLTGEQDQAEARAYGASDYLIKSNVSVQDVVARVSYLLTAG